jgi:hypothetical protein
VSCLNDSSVSGLSILFSCPNTALVSGLSILCLVFILPVSLDCPLCVLPQCCMCLWFIHQVSSLNITCVSDVSIMCLLSILHVSLVSPLCVSPQYCMCLICSSCVLSQYYMSLWFVHFRSCPNNACVSGLSIMYLVSILPVSLVCPFCVLSQ